MAVFCVVSDCPSHSDEEYCLFHRFPISNEDLLRKWTVALDNEQFVPSEFSFLCGKHFTVEDYEVQSGTLCLKADAVPSVFGNYEYQLSCPAEITYLAGISENVVTGFLGKGAMDDHDHSYCLPSSPKPKRVPNASTLERQALRKQLKTLQQKVRRKEKRIASRLTILKRLKQQNLIDFSKISALIGDLFTDEMGNCS